MKRSARFSPCGRYRYALWRTWDKQLPTILIIGLNPSTADAIEDDPTIRRCIRFAKERGFGKLAVANLFAFRANKVSILKRTSHPVGVANDRWLLHLVAQADVCVAAWGNDGRYLGRDAEVTELLKDLQCLGVTASGAPRHPLYVLADTKLRSFTATRPKKQWSP